MAGSFQHVTNPDGSFRGIDLIDNLGDAHEAIEELHDMVMYLSYGDRRLLYEAWLEGHVRKRYPRRQSGAPITLEEWWPRDSGEQP